MKIRAVLMDMDGTLLGKSQVAVSVSNMQAVEAAIRKGIQVIPCTGRVFGMLPPQILTQEGLRYFVLSHGARAYDAVSGESLYEDLIPYEESARLLEILEGKGLYNEIAANKTIYLEKAITEPIDWKLVPEHHVWYLRDHCYTALERPSEFFRTRHMGIEKMNLYGIPEAMQNDLYEKITATGYIRHTRPGAGANLEFSHHTLSKLRAVEAILTKLGISYEETMAIGDSSSDAEVLERCGVSVAMGNAPEEIKALAKDVTAVNTDNGLALAFQKYLL